MKRFDPPCVHVLFNSFSKTTVKLGNTFLLSSQRSVWIFFSSPVTPLRNDKYTPVNAIRATSHLVPSVTLSVDWLTADRTIRDETRFRSRQKSAISARPRRSRFLPRTIPFLLGAIRSHDQSSEHEQYCELSSIKQTGADLGFVYSFTLPVFRFFTRDISFAFKPWPFFARQLSIIDLIVPTGEYVTHERFIIEEKG